MSLDYYEYMNCFFLSKSILSLWMSLLWYDWWMYLTIIKYGKFDEKPLGRNIKYAEKEKKITRSLFCMYINFVPSHHIYACLLASIRSADLQNVWTIHSPYS